MGGDPVPGICEGLTQGVIGMTVGSRRRIVVPPEEVCCGLRVASCYVFQQLLARFVHAQEVSGFGAPHKGCHVLTSSHDGFSKSAASGLSWPN